MLLLFSDAMVQTTGVCLVLVWAICSLLCYFIACLCSYRVLVVAER